MQTVNIHEAKTHLSRLVEQAAKGKPMVKVMALNAPEAGQVKRLGFMAGLPDRLSADALALIGAPENELFFSRVLVAQATVEGIALLTSDPLVAQHPGPVRGGV